MSFEKNILRSLKLMQGKVPEEWKVWTWNEFYHDARAFGKTLIHLEVAPFKIVNILGFNSVGFLLQFCVKKLESKKLFSFSPSAA